MVPQFKRNDFVPDGAETLFETRRCWPKVLVDQRVRRVHGLNLLFAKSRDDGAQQGEGLAV